MTIATVSCILIDNESCIDCIKRSFWILERERGRREQILEEQEAFIVYSLIKRNYDSIVL